MTTMYQDGLAKALLGETTLEEVFRDRAVESARECLPGP